MPEVVNHYQIEKNSQAPSQFLARICIESTCVKFYKIDSAKIRKCCLNQVFDFTRLERQIWFIRDASLVTNRAYTIYQSYKNTYENKHVFLKQILTLQSFSLSCLTNDFNKMIIRSKNSSTYTVPTHNKHFSPNKHISNNKHTFFDLTKMCLL